MQNSVDNMAMAMMEAIAEFSKQKSPEHLSMVRVVIFQAFMVTIYHEQMQKATKPTSSLYSMITSPFRLFGKAIMGENYFTFLFNKNVPLNELFNHIMYIIERENTHCKCWFKSLKI